MRNNKGMTLVELVIVLGLMSALAGMTMTSVTDLDERSRAKTTRERLAAIRAGVLGTPNGSPGFLRDMGRLPQHADGKDEGKELEELWRFDGSQYRRIKPDSVALPAEAGYDADAFALYSGWRGPYLHCPGGAFFDGFGESWIVEEYQNQARNLEVAREVKGRIGLGEKDFESVVLLPASSTGNPTSMSSRIFVTVYLRHNNAHEYFVDPAPAGEETGYPEETGDSGETGDPEQTEDDEDGAETAAEPEKRYLRYTEGKWRIANSDAYNEIELHYVLFIPNPDADVEAQMVIAGTMAKDQPELQGQLELQTPDWIYSAQAKLYVYATVTGINPTGTPETITGNYMDGFFDGGNPLTLNLQPGDNFVEMYLRRKPGVTEE
ncbi:MAG: type II secretion system GspH family protein [Planctomycetota bacterium]|jgi:prepilin-type N-terminal cleavage/methylation domain-containing protein|nr:type II secretion system GspH family protein [Planctomycetota bacterium]